MTRLTIELPDDIYARVVTAAAEQHITPEQLVARVLAERFPPPVPTR